MITVRPKVAELVFQLYGRSLHPELFETYQTREIQRGDYTARIQITSAGHLVAWNYRGLMLTEVAAGAHHPLPQRRRLMAHRLRGERSDRMACSGAVAYEMQFALEPADEAKFTAYQQELTLQATRHGMLQRFETSGRFGAGALSYVNIDSRDKMLRIQAFHTFPDDRVMLKIQSVFRIG